MARLALIARIVVIGFVSALTLSGALRPFQSFLADQRYGFSRRAPTGGVVLVDIDEPSIRAIGVWPWKRSTYARIIDRLSALQADAIAFDVDFSSRSTPEEDAALEDALKRADGTVILAALQQKVGVGPNGSAVTVESRPLERFARSAWEGSVNVWPDPDDRIRWVSRGERFGKTDLLSLAVLLATGTGQANGGFLVDYGIDVARLDHVSVTKLLAGTVDPNRIQGKKVLVGASAVELRDFFDVPRFGQIAGAVVQAMAAESLLQGRALQPIGMPTTLAVTLCLLGLIGIAARRLRPASFLAVCLTSAVVVEAGALWIQTVWPLVPVTAPIHAGLIAFSLIALTTEIHQWRVKLQTSRRNANRLRVILDRVITDNFAGIVVVDQDGWVRAASGAAATILGPHINSGAAHRFEDVLPEPLARVLTLAIDCALAGTFNTSERCELQCVVNDGPPVTLDCVTTVSDIVERSPADRAGVAEFAICLTFQDVTEERKAQLRLAEMARVDVLSGLANRYVFLSCIEALEGAGSDKAVAVIFFDLDRFKLVNDRLGHAAGDALIKAVANRIRSLIGPGDVAARLGGDEFALIVERTSQRECQNFAEMLVRNLGGLYEIGSYQSSIGISVGLAFAEGHGANDLMSCADAALYAAKAAGGDCVKLYDAAMKELLEDGKLLAQDLREALRRGEFEVVYQRQVDIGSEQIVGVEALARWKHPERGYVSPAKFIPIAERTGLIEPLGAWVLATACKDAASWPLPIKVSVNLSAVQLARPDLASTILGALADAGLPPDQLDLELTESLLMDNDDLVRTTLGRLRAAGVKVSLDDFGTGYSSLSYLQTFAIDKVKIDQSFVRNLTQRNSSAAIIRAVIGLARDLGLRINAEGVETVDQLQLLRLLGCDEVQGYLHGKPEASPAIAASLAHQQSRNNEDYRIAS